MRYLAIAIACALSVGHVRAYTPDEASIPQLTSQAEKGDRKARHALCYRYLYGEGVSKDYAAAKHWCELASAMGIPSSQTLLAEIYFHGRGVTVDYKKAFDLFSAAARQDHRHAQYMLANMYAHGLGVPSDEVEAEKWLRRSAEAGYEPAKDVLRELEQRRRQQ